MSFTDRRRTLIAATMQSGLPSIYQQCEYISAASANGAYIDLGLSFDMKAKTEIIFRHDTTASVQLFGAAESSGKLRYMLTVSNSSSSEFFGSTGSSWIETVMGVWRASGLIKHIILSAEPGSLTFELKNVETNTNNKQGSYTMSNHLYLLGQNYNGNYRGSGDATIYSFKHWDKNDLLVRDMIPCYRKSDGVIGMYDFASKTFFTNAGSGSFTKGADV